MLQKLDQFHQTRAGRAVFGVVELGMAYGFLDWALDSGFWLWWIVTAFLLVGSIQSFVQAVWGQRK